jgi:histidinol-phosphate aminotransferase
MSSGAMTWPLRPELAGLHAYQPEAPLGDAALDANENPLAPPPEWARRAQLRLQQAELNRYPDPACGALRAKLAALHGVPPQSLAFGNGSDELISLLLTAFGGPGASVLLPSPTFSMYKLCALGQGWQVLEEPLGPAFELTQAFVERARSAKPRLVFLASPNNPTGNAFAPELIEALMAIEGVTLVLDEAYVEFSGRSWLAQAPTQGRVIVLRTFSKAWGLAGLRLGWLCAPPALVAELEKLRLPYNIDMLAQALAEEALDLAPLFLGRVAGLLEGRGQLRRALEALPGVTVFASDANFLLFRHPDAAGLHGRLLAAGLRVRRFGPGPLEGCLRLSVGTPAQNQRLEAAFKGSR